MPEERSLYEEFVDYAIYAPAGVVLSIVEDLPALVEKGRTRLSSQLGIANVVGRLAFRSLRKRVEAVIGDTSPKETIDVSARREETTRQPPSPPRPTISSDSLAIAGYDSLAASQIVARLDDLSGAELAAIRGYEEATRERRTILSRIAQLEHDASHPD